ncbi:aminopeptidase P family protein [Bacillus sp. H-16]|uniref:M24 family metallopeptidase n=1 Tax=Alteribacter salitolerans TaxID=2912333 RepID=UPI00196558F3|nr:Xaa-Pro peptidase family protein [Alteribacter salitolerans]MBM7096449.1 aminopeptidase P family protein [Alteribacter salitolerans]
MKNRLEKLKSWMKANEADIVMLQTRANVFFTTGFDTDPHERLVASCFFLDQDPLIICPGMEVNQVEGIFGKGDVLGYSDTDNPWKMIEKAWNERTSSVKKIAVERGLSWERLKALQSAFPHASFKEVDEALESARLIKDDEEVTLLKEAAALADFGVKAGVSALKEGISEMEVLASIEYELKKKGVREMAFSTMVLFGEKAGDPHGNPGSRRLQKGDAVLFDLGVIWKGYASDITRTVFFDHVKESDQAIYETVLTAQSKALAICKPGTAIGDLDKAARGWIEEKGYKDFFPHRLGHGLGIEVHEFPSMHAKNTDPLQEGMTFTIEPGIYLPNQAGVRIEDDVYITKDGYETFTKYPKELQIISSSA